MYKPLPVPQDVKDLPLYVQEELARLAAVLETETFVLGNFRPVAPDKKREGMVVGADGTNWNPGSGKGYYAYISGAWVKL